MTNDSYLPVDEVAERLGLPLGVLVRRVEAGDVPARRVESASGTRYELRLGDLGIEPWDLPSALDTDPLPVVELSGALAETEGPAPAESTRADAPWYTETAAPIKARTSERSAVEYSTTKVEAPVAAERMASVRAQVEQQVAATAAEAVIPPPRAQEAAEMTLIDYPRSGPLADIAAMSLDPRELVAGLLDRWERTLEQRIYAEQRQRFEAELTSRQNLVKELQLELKAARAEHAAEQANKDRVLAEREWEIQDRERALAEVRALAEARAAAAVPKRRGWLFRR